MTPARDMAGIPHAPGTKVARLKVQHPRTRKAHEILVPADHDGSRVRVEFPDGEFTWTEGWDPTERALRGERMQVPCLRCAALNAVGESGSFVCRECGAENEVEVKLASGSALGEDRERA